MGYRLLWYQHIAVTARSEETIGLIAQSGSGQRGPDLPPIPPGAQVYRGLDPDQV